MSEEERAARLRKAVEIEDLDVERPLTFSALKIQVGPCFNTL